MAAVEFELNGQSIKVDDVDPQCTLLDWLRTSGRTGSKEGCAEGECGACAVAFLSRDALGRPSFVAVNGCLVALPDVHGRSLVSVEGVSERGGPLHPVQQALIDRGGSQCGYCTPGFVVSAFCEYYRPGRCAPQHASRFDREAISGNLCRCTGYRPILEAVEQLGAPEPADPWLQRIGAGPAPLPPLEYAGRVVSSAGGAASVGAAGVGAAGGTAAGGTAAGGTAAGGVAGGAAGGTFLRPLGRGELARMLQDHPNAVLIAGGTDLMVYSNQRRARYPSLISVSALPELSRYEVRDDELVLGAALPLSAIEQHLAASDLGREFASLRELLPLFASRLIRNRATLGGNLATASPIGDAAPLLLALGARLTLASGTGQRQLPLAEFFLGYRKTALAPGEWIESIQLPRPAAPLQRFYKVSKRVLDDISTVAAAFTLDLRADGSVARLSAAYGGVAETPLLAPALGLLARDQPWNRGTLERLCSAARELGTPLSDQRGSAAYRSAMIVRLLERFFFETRNLSGSSTVPGTGTLLQTTGAQK